MKTQELWCVDTHIVPHIPLYIGHKLIEGFAGFFPTFHTEQLANKFAEEHSAKGVVVRQVTIILREDSDAIS